MKVLIVSQYFWPENFRINEIARELSCTGVHVEILTGKPNYPEGLIYPNYRAWGIMKEEYNGISVYRVPILERGSKSSIRLVLNYLSFIFSGCLIAPWLLRGKKFDLIFVYAPSPIFQVIPALFIGRLKRIPVVLWVQDLWPESVSATGYIKSRFILNVLDLMVSFCYKSTDMILVQSKAFISRIQKLTPNKKTFYFPNSVDESFYNPKIVDTPIIKSLSEGFTILFAGNVGSAQSIETIVQAAFILKKYTEIRIIILGSGSMLEWLIERKVEMDLQNIYIEGRYPSEVMPALMRSASALLVSLKAHPIFSLTIPNKIQAYLAVGRPIIGSLNGEGARVIEESKSGLVAPAEDAYALANQIIKMYMMSKDDLSQMGINGRKYFKDNFDQARLINELISYFENFKKR